MLEPAAVWLVRPGSPEAVPGDLSLEGGILRFAGEELTLDVPVSDIRRARRRRGTPILKISHGENGTLFLYFAPPPPLGPDRPSSRLRFMGRGMVRIEAAMQLRGEAKLVKRTIDEWVRALGQEG